MNRNTEFYEAFAPFYEQVYGTIDGREAVRQWLLLLEDLRLLPGKEQPVVLQLRLLDIGCGPGWYLAPWADAGFEVAGLDSSPGMLSRAADYYAAERGGKSCPLYLTDVRDPYTLVGLKEHFDVAVAHFNFLNLFAPTELESVFRGVAHFVRPGGLWMTDYSCPLDPLSDIEESYAEGSRSALLVRKGSHDATTNCYRLRWRGATLDSEEVYWFHSASEYEAAARLTGWSPVEGFEWHPDQRDNPWKGPTSTSERIVTVFRRV
jgi:SAM-dependent methyltransferase